MIIEKIELMKAPINSTYLNVFDFGQIYSGTTQQDEENFKIRYYLKLKDFINRNQEYGSILEVIGGISNATNIDKEIEITFTTSVPYIDLHEYSFAVITSGGKLFFYFIDDVVQENSIDKFKISLSWDCWSNNIANIKRSEHSLQYVKRRHINDCVFDGTNVKFTNDYRATDEGSLARENLGLFVAEDCDYFNDNKHYPKLDIMWLKIGVDRTMIRPENYFTDPVAPTQSHFAMNVFTRADTDETKEVELYDTDLLRIFQGETAYFYMPVGVKYQGNLENEVEEKVYIYVTQPNYQGYQSLTEARQSALASRNWGTIKRELQVQMPFDTSIDYFDYNIQDIVGGVVNEASITYNAPFEVFQECHYSNGEYIYDINITALAYGFPMVEVLGANGNFMKGAVAIPFSSPYQTSSTFNRYVQGEQAIVYPTSKTVNSSNLVVYTKASEGGTLLTDFVKIADTTPLGAGEGLANLKSMSSETIQKLWSKQKTYPYLKMGVKVGGKTYDFKPYNTTPYFSFNYRVTGEGIEYRIAEYLKQGNQYFPTNTSPLNSASNYKPNGNFQLTSTEFTDRLTRQPISFAIETLKPLFDMAVQALSMKLAPTVSSTSVMKTQSTKSGYNKFRQYQPRNRKTGRFETSRRIIEEKTPQTEVRTSTRQIINTPNQGEYLKTVAEGFSGATNSILANAGNGGYSKNDSNSSVTNTYLADRIIFYISTPLTGEISAMSIATECYYNGYYVEEIDDIHTRNKRFYEYIQTEHSQFPLILDQDCRSTIQEVFDSGVTIWNLEEDERYTFPILVGKKNIMNIKEEM